VAILYHISCLAKGLKTLYSAEVRAIIPVCWVLIIDEFGNNGWFHMIYLVFEIVQLVSLTFQIFPMIVVVYSSLAIANAFT